MPRALQLAHTLWAISEQGALRYRTSASTTWQTIDCISSQVVAITVSEPSNAVYAACIDRSIHAINATTAQIVLSAPAPQHANPNTLLALPKENALFIGLVDGAIIRLHLSTLEFDCMLGCGVEHTKAVNTLQADDQYLYSGADDANVLIWDLREGNAVREISMSTHEIHSLLLVDSGLWIGLSNGVVEVYDIFGDDTNGIDCLANEKAHFSPVVDLIRVGETEIWSLESTESFVPSSDSNTCNLVIWDTRDYTYRSADIEADAIIAALVVDRLPYEHATVVALTPSLVSKSIVANVRGTLCNLTDDTEQMETFIAELQHQLLEANDEIHRLRSTDARPRSTQAAIEPHQYLLNPQSQRGSHSNCGDSCEDECCPARLRRTFYDESVDDNHEQQQFDQLIITSSLSQCLMTSLNKLRDLLVSLLADDVLEEDETLKRNNEDLRRAVASITRELHSSRNLVERCTVQSDSPLPDENNDSSNTQRLPYAGFGDIVSQLHKDLDVERQRNLDLDNELHQAVKVRDTLTTEMMQIRQQTETTFSSLEEMVKEQAHTIEENEETMTQLSDKCKAVEDKYFREQQEREQLAVSLEEQLGALSQTAHETAKNFEDQLTAAYDKIEKKAIEIQAQRDSLRGTEAQVEALKATNQTLEAKYHSREEELEDGQKRYEKAVEKLESQLQVRTIQAFDVDVVKKQHAAELESVQISKNELVMALSAFQDEVDREKQNAHLELEAVKDERDRRDEQLEQMKQETKTAVAEYESKVSELHAKVAQSQEKIGTTNADWQQKLQEYQERTDLEVRVYKDRLGSGQKGKLGGSVEDDGDLQSDVTASNDGEETLALSEELHSRIQELEKDKEMLQKELEEREAAQDSYDNEVECLKTAIASYEKAVQAMEERISELERCEANKENDEGGKAAGALDNDRAANAILASAAGELSQMCSQLDAMQRTRKSQEKELMALRETLSTCDEQLRLRDREIEKLKQDGTQSLEPFSSPGLSFNMTPDISPSRLGDIQNSAFAKNINRMWDMIEPQSKGAVQDALRDIESGMNATQRKLRDLSRAAMNYKRIAQRHLDVLPALQELEGELIRLTQQEGRKGTNLVSARGIVQSVIAQYYTQSQRKAVLKDYDDTLYEASDKRLDALRSTVSRMRKVRTGNDEIMVQKIDDYASPLGRNGVGVPATRRLLKF